MHVLITGATGGIGQGICDALSHDLSSPQHALKLTVASSQSGERLDNLVQRLRAKGVAVQGVFGDVTQPDACEKLVKDAMHHHGDIDALVCVAGASGPGKLENLSVEQWDLTFQLNVRAVWLIAKAAFESLKRTQGSITAIASMSGLHPHPGYGGYSPAKSALIMLCRQLAQEWGSLGIRTNTVCPGMVRTPLTEAVYQDSGIKQQRESLVPLARIGTPEDIGAAVGYLIGNRASYVNGQNLVVDGGVSDHMLTMIPGRPGKAPIGQSM
jgi:3-oxoacyl-[acyl-carrier protein] reductase